MINDMLWQINAKTEFLINWVDLSCKSKTTNKNRQITSTIRDHFTNNWNLMKIHTLLSIKSLKPEQDKLYFPDSMVNSYPSMKIAIQWKF